MSEKTINHESKNEEFIVGLQGLSDFLGVSIATALRIKKKIPHYQMGRTLRFKKSEVLVALSKNPQTVSQ